MDTHAGIHWTVMDSVLETVCNCDRSPPRLCPSPVLRLSDWDNTRVLMIYSIFYSGGGGGRECIENRTNIYRDFDDARCLIRRRQRSGLCLRCMSWHVAVLQGASVISIRVKWMTEDMLEGCRCASVCRREFQRRRHLVMLTSTSLWEICGRVVQNHGHSLSHKWKKTGSSSP